jgi:hypothetical protein
MYEQIDDAKLQELIVDAESAWKKSHAVQDLNKVYSAGFLRALSGVKAAEITKMKDPNRTPKIKMWWIEACDDENHVVVTNNAWVRGIPCSHGGFDISTNSAEYELKKEFKIEFVVPTTFHESKLTPEMAFAAAYNKAVFQLTREIDTYIGSKLFQWAGINKHQFGIGKAAGVAPNAWNLTKVPYWNTNSTDFPAYLDQLEDYNGFAGGIMIDGGMLSLNTREAQGATLETYSWGDRRVYKAVKSFNTLGMQPTANGLYHGLYVSPGSVCIVNDYNNKSESPVTKKGSGYEFMLSSRNLPGGFVDGNGDPIKMDLKVERIMSPLEASKYQGYDVTGKCQEHDYFRLSVFLDIFLNPRACGQEMTTGIIHVVADKAVAPEASAERWNNTWQVNA